MEKLTLEVIDCIYYNEENNYGVYVLGSDEHFEYSMLNTIINKHTCKFVGNMGNLALGTKCIIKAEHDYNEKYNSHQYKVLSIQLLAPTNTEDSYKILKHIINETYATTLLEVYPNIINDIIENNNYTIDYTKTKGIKEYTFNKIKQKILDTYENSDLVMLLSPYGISQLMINKISKLYVNKITMVDDFLQNPYAITTINGIGFKTADKIALKINSSFINSRYRAESFIYFILEHYAQTYGHTFLYFSDFFKECQDNIIECKNEIFNIIKDNSTKWLYINPQLKIIGLKKYKDTETYVLDKLLYIKEKQKYWSDEEFEDIKIIKQHIKETEEKQGFTFTDEQINGIQTIVKNPITCIIGNAGTGKSTVSNGFLNMFSKQGKTILQCCLSGKASLRLKEINGYNAITIHKLVYTCKTYNKSIDQDILVIDEASMIGLELFEELLKYLTANTKLIIMGDVGQLDSIGVGNIFKDILNSKLFPVVELTKIHRQAQKSAIITDSIKIRHKKPIIPKYFVGEEVHGELQDLQIRSYAHQRATFDNCIKDYLDNYKLVGGVSNIQLVLPMNSRGQSSVFNVNNTIQQYVNPTDKSKKEIQIKHKDNSYILREQDKVMNITNNYNLSSPIFNGNIGVIKVIYNEYMVIDFIGIGEVEVPQSWYNNIVLAYASTCHKLQGSEFDVVVVGIDMTAYMLLSNQWIYTAITRAKKKCYLNCQYTALELAISNYKTTKRNTYFNDYIDLIKNNK